MEKNVIKILHPYIPAMVNRTERWLKQKSNEGWRPIEFNRIFVTFRKCSPYNGEFLIYSGFDASKGLSFDYNTTKTKYQKATSKINKLIRTVFEADPTKLDSEYFRFKKMRNAYYLKHYALLSVFSFFAVTGLSVTMLLSPFRLYLVFLMIVWQILLIYAFVSLLILKLDIILKDN